ncbi:MAG: spermidine/putrescine transport system ATP-binding protein [Frankiaceae bacterium]|jgi:spermidine/putrescine transport system ATP-binding protein|nr:spermidine/putrescine transport system ATP-binding protein [Frankiaceae bacterium]
MTVTEGGVSVADGAVAADSSAQDVAAIELVDVAKDFGGGADSVQAVRQVDVAIRPGEFFSLLGPSGCGKTTTLRMIAGFEEPTRGRILLYGDDMVGVPPYRRDVNMVFQSYALFPHLSVYDNIAFGLQRKKLGKSEIAWKVQQMLEIVRLEGKERRRPAELSGGQQQRVALARALVNQPRALLLDEPLAALDLKLRQTMQVELKRIQREVGITFIFVTHDQNEALTLSDRLIVMNEGLVEQLGTPHEIYEQPATKFVAGFIGTSNVLQGVVDRIVGARAVVVPADGEQVLVPATGLRAGQQVELTVRPEKVVIHAGGEVPAGERSAVRGTVTDVTYLGTSTTYTVSRGDESELVVFQQNASSPTAAARPGDIVWLSWLPEHSYVFASASHDSRSPDTAAAS